jgi:hypothetical protein
MSKYIHISDSWKEQLKEKNEKKKGIKHMAFSLSNPTRFWPAHGEDRRSYDR